MLIALGDVVEGHKVDPDLIKQAYEQIRPPTRVYQDVRGGLRSRNVNIGFIRESEIRANGTELWVRFDYDYPNMHNRRALLGPCPDEEGLCVAAVTPVRLVPGDRESSDRIGTLNNSDEFKSRVEQRQTSDEREHRVRGPQDFEKLTKEDLEQVKDLLTQMEQWFEQGHEAYRWNTVADNNSRKIPRKVLKEFVRRADEAGWDATFSGAIVEIRRPD